MRPSRPAIFLSLLGAAALHGRVALAEGNNPDGGIVVPIAPGYKVTRVVAYAYSGAIRPNTTRGSTRTLEEGGLPMTEARMRTVQKDLADLFVTCTSNAPRPSQGRGFSLPDTENAIFMRKTAVPNISRIFLDGTATYETINGSTVGHFVCILEGKKPALWYFVPDY